MRKRSVLSATALLVVFVAAPTAGQTSALREPGPWNSGEEGGQAAAGPLPMGEMTAGTVGDEPAVYSFSAATAGLLSIMVKGDVDLVIEVTDAIGQQIEDGRADSDLFGDSGTERLALLLRRPGEYRVRVRTFMGSGDFQVGATWLAVPAIEVAADPDGSPASAQPLVPGTPVDGSVDESAGDSIDWYVVEATADAVVTIISEGEDDVYLEVFADGEFDSYLDRSDQDLQEMRGNESVTVRLRAGEKVFLKVGAIGREASYRLRVGMM